MAVHRTCLGGLLVLRISYKRADLEPSFKLSSIMLSNFLLLLFMSSGIDYGKFLFLVG